MTEKVQYKKKIAIVAASCAFLGFAFLSILTSSAMDINSVVKALVKSFPGMLTLGLLGYFMGSVFDNRRGSAKKLILPDEDIADILENATSIPLTKSTKKEKETEVKDET